MLSSTNIRMLKEKFREFLKAKKDFTHLQKTKLDLKQVIYHMIISVNIQC